MMKKKRSVQNNTLTQHLITLFATMTEFANPDEIKSYFCDQINSFQSEFQIAILNKKETKHKHLLPLRTKKTDFGYLSLKNNAGEDIRPELLQEFEPIITLLASILENQHSKLVTTNQKFKLEDEVRKRTTELLMANMELEREIHEKNLTQENLKKSEDKFSKIFQFSPDAIIITRMANSMIIDVNEVFVNIFEYPRKELISKLVDDTPIWVDAKDRHEFKQLLKQLGKVENLETALRTRSGKILYMVISSTIIEIDNEKCILTISRDITRRKQIEDSLRQLKKAVETMHLGVTITDTAGKIIYVNPADARIHGFDIDELIGQDVGIYSLFESRQPISIEKINLYKSFLRESVNVRKDGSIFPVWLISDVVKDAYDKPIAFITTCEDITDRKKAEQALSEEKERLSVTLRSITDGVITTDINGNIVLLNRAAEIMTGWKQSEVAGRLLSDVFHIINEGNREPAEDPVSKILREGAVVGLSNHTILIRRDGEEIAISDSGAPIKTKDGKMIGVVLVMRDTTEHRRLELAKRHFLNAISHELRTPLTPILGYVELMQTFELSEEQRQSFLKEIVNAVHREEKLVDELIAIARLESGIEQYNFRELNAHAFLSSIETNNLILVKQLIQNRYETENFHYQYELDLSLRSVLLNVDSLRIQQAIENLLTNAVKFSSPKDLYIHFLAKIEDNQLKIVVSDHGKGIPLNEQDKVFKPFYQIRKDGDDISDGIGQGLTLTKQYIEAHKGRIFAQPNPESKGTQFIIYLPVIRKPVRLKTIENIFLIEDDESTATFIRLLLKKHNYECYVAFEGEAGLKQIKKNPPDLLILDLQLPDMEGKEVINQLLNEKVYIPIIICSAQPKEKLQYLVHQYPPLVDYIEKPFNIKKLLEKINLLEKKMNAENAI